MELCTQWIYPHCYHWLNCWSYPVGQAGEVGRLDYFLYSHFSHCLPPMTSLNCWSNQGAKEEDVSLYSHFWQTQMTAAFEEGCSINTQSWIMYWPWYPTLLCSHWHRFMFSSINWSLSITGWNLDQIPIPCLVYWPPPMPFMLVYSLWRCNLLLGANLWNFCILSVLLCVAIWAPFTKMANTEVRIVP